MSAEGRSLRAEWSERLWRSVAERRREAPERAERSHSRGDHEARRRRPEARVLRPSEIEAGASGLASHNFELREGYAIYPSFKGDI